MSRPPSLVRWFAMAALADWLIARTITRSAIFMPKSPPVVAVYQALGLAGQFASVLSSLCALLTVGWIAWHSLRTRREFGRPVVLSSLLVLSIAFLFIAPGGWPAAAYHLLVMAAVVVTGWRVWTGAGETRNKIGWTIPALAILAGVLYQLSHALYAAMRWPGPPPFADFLFNLGELFVVLAPAALAWTVKTHHAVSLRWAALPALAFAAAYLANPAMTGIIAVWSTGLTLYLPWPLYAVSLWLAGGVVIDSLRRGDVTGWALLLLAAGGYAAQSSTQVFAGLAALWLAASPAEKVEADFNARSVQWTTSNASSA